MKGFKSNVGFSLAEVAIAVGVAAMALVAILGVIPSSLESVRRAGEITTNSRLVAQISSEIQSSDWGRYDSQENFWEKLERFLEQRWYFDDQANVIDLADRNFDQRIAYVVRVVYAEEPFTLPGQAEDSRFTYALRVDIANSTQTNYPFSNPRAFSSFPIIVAKQFSTEAVD